MIIESTVNRSKHLKCSCCKKPFPMGTTAYFRLIDSVYCNDCLQKNNNLVEEYENDYADSTHDIDDT